MFRQHLGAFVMWTLHISIPTQRGIEPTQDFGEPFVPVSISPADGLRLLLGTADHAQQAQPDIQFERRSHGWALFVIVDSVSVGYVYILDDGRTFLVPESTSERPIAIVDAIPAGLDG